jgi:hypothetical protein
MKTLAKIVYVEPDEEVTDVVDRLRELQGEQAVTLVLPDGARALHSPMSFRLVKKYAQAYRLQVSVVSSETRLQALSLESGFPTYASVQAVDRGQEMLQPGAVVATEEAPPAEVEPVSAVPEFEAVSSRPVLSAPPRRMPFGGVPLLRVPRLRERLQEHRRPLYIGAGVLAAVAFLAGILYLPAATVTIAVQGTKLDADVQLAGAPGTQAAGATQFTTQPFTVTESQQAQGTATGQKAIPAVPATGSVTFTYNCFVFCSPYVDIPRGVVVRTSDGSKSYTTDKDLHVPGPKGSASVGVTASQPGQGGNTDARTVKQIDRNPQDLTVDNPTPIGGGADARTATVISDTDSATASQALLDILNPKVQSELNQKTGSLHLVQESLAIDHTATMDHHVGDELPAATPTFNITMTVTGKATAFNDAAVRQLIQHALQGKIPAGQQLSEEPVNTGYEVVSASADGKVTLTGHARGFVRPVFSLADIRARLKGRSPNSARPLLSGLPSVVDVNVRQDLPLPWLPFFASRIVVKVQEATGGFAS